MLRGCNWVWSFPRPNLQQAEGNGRVAVEAERIGSATLWAAERLLKRSPDLGALNVGVE